MKKGPFILASSAVFLFALLVWINGAWAGVARVAAGRAYTVVVKCDGSLWAWGDNYYGQLGDGTSVNKSSPVQIGAATDWQTVATGFDHTIALKKNGSLWAWGDNRYGQLGDGTKVNKNKPVQIGAATDWQIATAGSNLGRLKTGFLAHFSWPKLGPGFFTTLQEARPSFLLDLLRKAWA
ncbi:MAG: hypothetical protein D3923_11885, partial [Candidatus Electrothrix sp. AR3]|nr:hypothetical protein [Candidatus Electrothrix sp. AR3]